MCSLVSLSLNVVDDVIPVKGALLEHGTKLLSEQLAQAVLAALGERCHLVLFQNVVKVRQLDNVRDGAEYFRNELERSALDV